MIRRIDSEIAENIATLSKAPPWYRPEMQVEEAPAVFGGQVLEFNKAFINLKRASETLHRLEPELARVNEGRLNLDKAHKAAIEWFNGVNTPEEFRTELEIDPATKATSPDITFSDSLVETLLAHREIPPPGIARLKELLAETGVTNEHLAHLHFTGVSRLAKQEQPVTSSGIAVLLPARLETRLYEPDEDNDRFRLRVRIFPDEPWFDRHDPLPTEEELLSVEQLWAQLGQQGLAEGGGAAWEVFVHRHGGGRAAWLARTWKPEPFQDELPTIERPEPAAIQKETVFSQLRDLPSHLEVWIKFRNKEAERKATLELKTDQLELAFPDDDPTTLQGWWSSYELAKEVGLAAELPLGTGSPDDIEAIYVVGIGTETPEGLFQSHSDSGRLAVMSQGTATNTVEGEPTTDLGHDPEVWRRVATAPTIGNVVSQQISQVMTGKTDGLGSLAGTDFDDRSPGEFMGLALWPALFGHAAKDIWGWPLVGETALWASQNLHPCGTLPPIRIGRQPYGILPVTSFPEWVAEPNDPKIEDPAIKSLVVLLQDWARQAEDEGNVSGADTNRLLDLIGRTAQSQDFAYRNYFSESVLSALLWTFDNGHAISELRARWKDAAQSLLEVSPEPNRLYFTLGWPQDLQLPLVEPSNLVPGFTLKSVIETIVSLAPGRLLNPNSLRDTFGGEIPNSLLVRLLIFVCIRTAADVRLASLGAPPELELPFSPSATDTMLALRAKQMTSADLAKPTIASAIYHAVRNAAAQLSDYPTEVLERHMRAALDTASHRVDPWATGIAWRRFRQQLNQGIKPVLGLYGWVDGPLVGEPGPTEGGVLHAPSESQAITAAILRDKEINEPEDPRWQMNLDSARIRRADRWSREVRMGVHLHELLGREVESIVGKVSLVDQLRDRFPFRKSEKRRTCDGKAALDAIEGDLEDLSLDENQKSELKEIRETLDAYGDLLVMEAVHHVVSGRGEIAGAAMDAAAGLLTPPSLTSIQTPRHTFGVHTLVGFVLPPGEDPSASPETSPGRIADPAVADFLETKFGKADSSAWQWTVRSGHNNQTIQLADVDLDPIDTMSLSAGELETVILEQATGGDVFVDRVGSATHERARAWMNILGSRPMLPSDFGATDEADAGVLQELETRYARLRDSGEQLLGFLNSAGTTTADETSQRSALKASMRWGIIPLKTGTGDETLKVMVGRARDALASRLKRLPLSDDVVGLGESELAASIAELASPEGRLCILGKFAIASFGPFSASKESGSGLNSVDSDWLTVVAAVREPLARLECAQLELALDDNLSPMSAWSNQPEDIFGTNAFIRDENNELPNLEQTVNVNVIYGPSETVLHQANNATIFSVGFLDRWSEAVPDIEQSTAAAFGFNAPKARAPQAILLATTPELSRPLDGKGLVQILEQTRLLTRARSVSPADVSAYATAPGPMLPASGKTAVDLEP